MFDLCELRLLPEHFVVIKKPEASQVAGQGHHVDFVADRDIQLDNNSGQADKLFVLGDIKLKALHIQIEQEGVHQPDHHQQDFGREHGQEGEHFPVVTPALLQLQQL